MPQLIESSVSYLALKAAQKLYSKAPAALRPDEFERVQTMALQQHELEARVLVTPEARDVMVPPSTMEAALQEIRGRYTSEEEFVNDLMRNKLDETSLATALEREMKVEAILEKVGAQAVKISDMDLELYYQFHSEQFLRPETRLARHILITINETIADNTRSAAHKRISILSTRLAKEPQRFKEQASNTLNAPPLWTVGSLAICREANFSQSLIERYSN